MPSKDKSLEAGSKSVIAWGQGWKQWWSVSGHEGALGDGNVQRLGCSDGHKTQHIF